MTPELQQSLDVIRRWLADIDRVQPVQSSLTIEEKKQLQTVNRAIAHLEKLGVTVPDDLRELKLNLSVRDSDSDLDQALSEKLNSLDDLIESLRGLRSEAKKIRDSFKTRHSGTGAKKYFGVQVVQLIKARLLSTESRIELRWAKEGEVFEGRLRNDGRVAVRSDLGWKEYDSLSTAASETAGRSLNGWRHWRLVEPNGNRTPLI